MKKIAIAVGYLNEPDIWTEIYDVPDATDAQKYGQTLIEQYNASLRPGERLRMFLGADDLGVTAKGSSLKHEWEKSNLVTVTSKSGSYDTYRCTQCGATGRRYGFAFVIKRDKKYSSRSGITVPVPSSPAQRKISSKALSRQQIFKERMLRNG